MAKDRLSRKLAVILHADVIGSTKLVQQNETLAHERIQNAFQRFCENIEIYGGNVLELRGDALLAEFERPSDAVTASLAFQADHTYQNSLLEDDLRPAIRVGIAMGEVIIADNTVTGAGVVLAQRVEQLADADGLCITAALHEALPKGMPFDLDDMGEHELKGFDHTVRVYRVELSANNSIPPPEQSHQPASTLPRWSMVAIVAVAVVIAIGVANQFFPASPMEEPALPERMAFPLPDKPSIAVLPFVNMSDDVQQEYFADGMTEDLITDISKVSGLFVIARNSVFTYKGKAVKIRQVAEELGVRYVLEGSVRRVGNQVRINTQLIDATTGGHIWAERYDGALDDVFTMQDKISQRIVTALAGTLTGQDDDGNQDETSNPDAYDAFLRGWERYRLGTPGDLVKAVTYFEQAIDLDPDYARAQSALAAAYWTVSLNGWSRNLGLVTSQIREQSRLSLRKAMEQPSALTYQVASEKAAYLYRKPDRALTEAERAIALDANDPAGHLAMATALIKAGRASEAMKFVRTAMRLDPHYPAFYLTRLGQTQFVIGQYKNAAASLEKAARRNPEDEWTFVYLAATYGQLGHEDKAKKAIEKANVLRAKSGWGALTTRTVGDNRDSGGRRYYFKWFGDYKPLRQGLFIAGVRPEANWSSLISHEASGIEVKGVTTIDAQTAKTLHERGVPFIDIYISWNQKRIPGAHFLNLLYHKFNEVTLPETVSKTQEFVIYSSRSEDYELASRAAAQAAIWGFEKIYYFRDGLKGWEDAGYPVETGKRQ